MKAIGVVVALAVGGGLTWAVLSNGDRPGTQEASAFTGCLRTGSASSVYVLRGAAPAASGPTVGEAEGQMRRDYLLVSVASGIDLNGVLNHRVTITGVATAAADGPEPPGEANAAERALRRLTVQQLRDDASDCSSP